VILEDLERDSYLVERVIDPDLTSIGQQQARLVADYVSRAFNLNGFDPQNRDGFGLTHLYCSLMTRAIKTGREIAKRTGLPLVARPEVHETGGVFTVEMVNGEPTFIGQPGPGRDYFTSKFPELILTEDISAEGWWNREKESRDAYNLRAQLIIDGLLAEHGEKDHRVAVVTHGGIFARILTVLFNVKAERYWFLMNNCGISRIDIGDDGRPMMSYMNKVDFLPDHLVT